MASMRAQEFDALNAHLPHLGMVFNVCSSAIECTSGLIAGEEASLLGGPSSQVPVREIRKLLWWSAQWSASPAVNPYG